MKALAYRRLPSLEEYVLVTQDTQRVEVYRRETGWDLELYENEGGFSLRSVGLDLSIGDVYEGVLETP